jgi:hypothetical protein
VWSGEFREAGSEPDLVYSVELSTPAGERNDAYFLLWNVILGPTTVVVRWHEARRTS